MDAQPYRVAVVGATGQVGTLMLELLRERKFPAAEIVAFASERSAGRELAGGLIVQELSEDSIQGFDLALFSAGGSISSTTTPPDAPSADQDLTGRDTKTPSKQTLDPVRTPPRPHCRR